MIPREHGAWAMLLIPFIVGTAISKSPGWASLAFLVTCATFFMARYPLSLWWRSRGKSQAPEETRRQVVWFAIYSAAAFLSVLALLFLLKRPLVLLLGLPPAALLPVFLYLQQRRLERSIAGQLLAIAGLSWTAPMAYYAGAGIIDSRGLTLWGLSFLYSAASVFYVKMRVKQKASAGRGGSADAEKRNMVLYLVLLVLALAALEASRLIPILAPIAYVPLVVKCLIGVIWSPAVPSIKRIGLLELGHSLVFALLVVAAHF